MKQQGGKHLEPRPLTWQVEYLPSLVVQGYVGLDGGLEPSSVKSYSLAVLTINLSKKKKEVLQALVMSHIE